MAGLGSTIDDLKKEIVRSIRQHWDENNQTAMLLTSLGIQIRKSFPNAEALMPNGLINFINTNNLAQVIKDPDNPGKTGAIPIDVHCPEDVKPLFTATRPRHSKASLSQDFWDAFHLPLTGRRFVINSGAGFSVQDLSAGEPNAEKWHEIKQEDIAPYDGSPLPELVRKKWEKINGWVAKNGLTIDMFANRYKPPPRQPGEINLPIKPSSGLGLFSTLEQQDQARILIPLDIVNKILSSR
jgi:hypothetical protein